MFVEDAVWYKKQQYRKTCIKRVILWSICTVVLFFVCFTVMRVVAMEAHGEVDKDRRITKENIISEGDVSITNENQKLNKSDVMGTVGSGKEISDIHNQLVSDGDSGEVIFEEMVSGETFVDGTEEEVGINEDGRYVIAIDAGHGGVDEGCSFTGVEEKTVNLKLALLVQNKLQNLGFATILLRMEDEELSLEERAERVKEVGANVLVSIHQNSCEEKDVQGVETWYYAEREESRRLARLVQQYTVLYGKTKDRGTIESENLYLLRECGIPACLVETGFLSNETERGKLQEDAYLDKLAQGITDGVELYFYPKTMYLTFDDGPNTENTNAVLDILKEKNIKAMFFLVGKNVERNPETARRIVAEGHSIGVHCYNHDYNLLYKDVQSYVADFEKAKQVIYEVTGVETRMFRFPGGSINSYNKAVYRDIVATMTEAGYVYFDWNASLEDAVKKPVPEKLLQNAKESTLGRKQVVMLAHDTVDATVECLEELLEMFPEYEMKVLEEGVEGVRF